MEEESAHITNHFRRVIPQSQIPPESVSDAVVFTSQYHTLDKPGRIGWLFDNMNEKVVETKDFDSVKEGVQILNLSLNTPRILRKDDVHILNKKAIDLLEGEDIDIPPLLDKETKETQESKEKVLTHFTNVRFCYGTYRIVFAFDISPSMNALDPMTGDVVIDRAMPSFRKILHSCVKGVKVNSSIEFFPKIVMSVLAVGGIFRPIHTLFQNLQVSLENYEEVCKKVEDRFDEVLASEGSFQKQIMERSDGKIYESDQDYLGGARGPGVTSRVQDILSGRKSPFPVAVNTGKKLPNWRNCSFTTLIQNSLVAFDFLGEENTGMPVFCLFTDSVFTMSILRTEVKMKLTQTDSNFVLVNLSNEARGEFGLNFLYCHLTNQDLIKFVGHSGGTVIQYEILDSKGEMKVKVDKLLQQSLLFRYSALQHGEKLITRSTYYEEYVDKLEGKQHHIKRFYNYLYSTHKYKLPAPLFVKLVDMRCHEGFIIRHVTVSPEGKIQNIWMRYHFWPTIELEYVLTYPNLAEGKERQVNKFVNAEIRIRSSETFHSFFKNISTYVKDPHGQEDLISLGMSLSKLIKRILFEDRKLKLFSKLCTNPKEKESLGNVLMGLKQPVVHANRKYSLVENPTKFGKWGLFRRLRLAYYSKVDKSQPLNGKNRAGRDWAQDAYSPFVLHADSIYGGGNLRTNTYEDIIIRSNSVVENIKEMCFYISQENPKIPALVHVYDSYNVVLFLDRKQKHDDTKKLSLMNPTELLECMSLYGFCLINIEWVSRVFVIISLRFFHIPFNVAQKTARDIDLMLLKKMSMRFVMPSIGKILKILPISNRDMTEYNNSRFKETPYYSSYMDHKKWIWYLPHDSVIVPIMNAIVSARQKEGFIMVSRRGCRIFMKTITLEAFGAEKTYYLFYSLHHLNFSKQILTEYWLEPLYGNFHDLNERQVRAIIRQALMSVDTRIFCSYMTFEQLFLMCESCAVNPKNERALLFGRPKMMQSVDLASDIFAADINDHVPFNEIGYSFEVLWKCGTKKRLELPVYKGKKDVLFERLESYISMMNDLELEDWKKNGGLCNGISLKLKEPETESPCPSPVKKSVGWYDDEKKKECVMFARCFDQEKKVALTLIKPPRTGGDTIVVEICECALNDLGSTEQFEMYSPAIKELFNMRDDTPKKGHHRRSDSGRMRGYVSEIDSYMKEIENLHMNSFSFEVYNSLVENEVENLSEYVIQESIEHCVEYDFNVNITELLKAVKRGSDLSDYSFPNCTINELNLPTKVLVDKKAVFERILREMNLFKVEHSNYHYFYRSDEKKKRRKKGKKVEKQRFVLDDIESELGKMAKKLSKSSSAASVNYYRGSHDYLSDLVGEHYSNTSDYSQRSHRNVSTNAGREDESECQFFVRFEIETHLRQHEEHVNIPINEFNIQRILDIVEVQNDKTSLKVVVITKNPNLKFDLYDVSDLTKTKLYQFLRSSEFDSYLIRKSAFVLDQCELSGRKDDLFNLTPNSTGNLQPELIEQDYKMFSKEPLSMDQLPKLLRIASSGLKELFQQLVSREILFCLLKARIPDVSTLDVINTHLGRVPQRLHHQMDIDFLLLGTNTSLSYFCLEVKKATEFSIKEVKKRSHFVVYLKRENFPGPYYLYEERKEGAMDAYPKKGIVRPYWLTMQIRDAEQKIRFTFFTPFPAATSTRDEIMDKLKVCILSILRKMNTKVLMREMFDSHLCSALMLAPDEDEQKFPLSKFDKFVGSKFISSSKKRTGFVMEQFKFKVPRKRLFLFLDDRCDVTKVQKGLKLKYKPYAVENRKNLYVYKISKSGVEKSKERFVYFRFLLRNLSDEDEEKPDDEIGRLKHSYSLSPIGEELFREFKSGDTPSKVLIVSIFGLTVPSEQFLKSFKKSIESFLEKKRMANFAEFFARNKYSYKLTLSDVSFLRPFTDEPKKIVSLNLPANLLEYPYLFLMILKANLRSYLRGMELHKQTRITKEKKKKSGEGVINGDDLFYVFDPVKFSLVYSFGENERRSISHVHNKRVSAIMENVGFGIAFIHLHFLNDGKIVKKFQKHDVFASDIIPTTWENCTVSDAEMNYDSEGTPQYLEMVDVVSVSNKNFSILLEIWKRGDLSLELLIEEIQKTVNQSLTDYFLELIFGNSPLLGKGDVERILVTPLQRVFLKGIQFNSPTVRFRKIDCFIPTWHMEDVVSFVSAVLRGIHILLRPRLFYYDKSTKEFSTDHALINVADMMIFMLAGRFGNWNDRMSKVAGIEQITNDGKPSFSMWRNCAIVISITQLKFSVYVYNMKEKTFNIQLYKRIKNFLQKSKFQVKSLNSLLMQKLGVFGVNYEFVEDKRPSLTRLVDLQGFQKDSFSKKGVLQRCFSSGSVTGQIMKKPVEMESQKLIEKDEMVEEVKEVSVEEEKEDESSSATEVESEEGSVLTRRRPPPLKIKEMKKRAIPPRLPKILSEEEIDEKYRLLKDVFQSDDLRKMRAENETSLQEEENDFPSLLENKFFKASTTDLKRFESDILGFNVNESRKIALQFQMKDLEFQKHDVLTTKIVRASKGENVDGEFSLTDVKFMKGRGRIFHVVRFPLFFNSLSKIVKEPGLFKEKLKDIDLNPLSSHPEELRNEVNGYKKFLSDFLENYKTYLSEQLSNDLIMSIAGGNGNGNGNGKKKNGDDSKKKNEKQLKKSFLKPLFELGNKVYVVKSGNVTFMTICNNKCMIFEVFFRSVWVCVNMYVFEPGTIKISAEDNLKFHKKTTQIRNEMHLNSFVRDFQLRKLFKYLKRGKTPFKFSVLRFLSDFQDYYARSKTGWAYNRVDTKNFSTEVNLYTHQTPTDFFNYIKDVICDSREGFSGVNDVIKVATGSEYYIAFICHEPGPRMKEKSGETKTYKDQGVELKLKICIVYVNDFNVEREQNDWDQVIQKISDMALDLVLQSQKHYQLGTLWGEVFEENNIQCFEKLFSCCKKIRLDKLDPTVGCYEGAKLVPWKRIFDFMIELFEGDSRMIVKGNRTFLLLRQTLENLPSPQYEKDLDMEGEMDRIIIVLELKNVFFRRFWLVTKLEPIDKDNITEMDCNFLNRVVNTLNHCMWRKLYE